MVKGRYALVLALVFCLTTTLFIFSGIGYDPWVDQDEDGDVDASDLYVLSQEYGTSGDSTKNVSVTNWPSSLSAEHTTRKVAVYGIDYVACSGSAYSKAGEIAVPTGEKWYLYKINFMFSGPLHTLKVRLVLRGTVMMDEVLAGQFPLTTNAWTGKTCFVYAMELRKPIELFEDETIELWARMDNSGTGECGLTIEAWVEEM